MKKKLVTSVDLNMEYLNTQKKKLTNLSMSKVYIKKVEDKTFLLTILYSKNETHLAINFALRVNFPFVCTYPYTHLRGRNGESRWKYKSYVLTSRISFRKMLHLNVTVGEVQKRSSEDEVQRRIQSIFVTSINTKKLSLAFKILKLNYYEIQPHISEFSKSHFLPWRWSTQTLTRNFVNMSWDISEYL